MLPRKVLVVDDDDIIREVAKLALEVVGGWQVSTATNGQEAGRLASLDRPDVVLLDVMMPALDGPGTAALLREDPAHPRGAGHLLDREDPAQRRAAGRRSRIWSG